MTYKGWDAIKTNQPTNQPAEYDTKLIFARFATGLKLRVLFLIDWLPRKS